MPSDEITSIGKRNVVPTTFPKERGEENACSSRRGFRSVVRYVFLETRNNIACSIMVYYNVTCSLFGEYCIQSLLVIIDR